MGEEQNEKLVERITTLEKRANLILAVSTAIIIGFPIAFGIQYFELPRKAAERAERAAEEVFTQEAEKIAATQVSEKLKEIIDSSKTGSKMKDVESYYLLIQGYKDSSEDTDKKIQELHEAIKKIHEEVSIGKFRDLQITGTLSVEGDSNLNEVNAEKVNAKEHILLGGGGIGLFLYSDPERIPSISMGYGGAVNPDKAKRYAHPKYFVRLIPGPAATGKIEKEGF